MHKKLILKVIQLYRLCISPFLMPRCRFHPSCSEYARDAFLSHTIAKALYLTSRRLLRCHPFNRGGYDPVPQLKRETHGF